MRRRVGVVAIALLCAIGITACNSTVDKSRINKNKDTSASSEESKDEEKDEDKEEEKYSPIVAEDVKIDEDSEYPYMIKVNRSLNCITVYTLDKDGEYTVPERALLCSVGGEAVPAGTFQLGESAEWQMLSNGDFGRYVTRVVDNVVFRSVNYKAQSEDALDVEAYNSLGDTIDDSAIVLSEADAQWIAENCPEGTKVEIYEDEDEPGELGKPLARLISGEITWDPTDTSDENAWYVPVSFFGVTDRTIKTGTAPDLLEGVSAKDKYGNDLTASIKVYGEVDVNKAGDYTISYSCENTDGEKREVEAVITVEEGQEVPAEETQEPAAPQAAEQPVQDPVTTPVVTETPAAQASNQSSTTVVTTITTVEEVDVAPPVITFTAKSSSVTSLKDEYLYKRIKVTDAGSGVDDVYISLCRIPNDGSYVVIYEAFDKAGNSSCVSETVFLVD